MTLRASDPPKNFFPQKHLINNLEGKFPFTSKILIFREENATKFVNDNIISVNNNEIPCTVVKARVFTDNILNISQFLPYFSYKNNKKKQSLTLCKMCSDSLNSLKCTHSKTERSFLVTCLGDDIHYAFQLGYRFSIIEVHYWPLASNYPSLTGIADSFIRLRDTSELFYAKVIKSWSLGGLGRFALNISKYGFWRQIDNMIGLIDLATSKKISQFDLLSSDLCYGLIKTQKSNILHRKNKSNVCVLVLSYICSYVKRKIHSDSILINSSKNLKLIRIDADCVSIKILLNNKAYSECNTIFNKNNEIFFYKLEMDKIKKIVSFKRRSYLIVREKYSIFKSCGFTATLYSRFTTIDFEKFYSEYKQNLLNGKIEDYIQYQMRIPISSINLNMYDFSTIPFGFRQV